MSGTESREVNAGCGRPTSYKVWAYVYAADLPFRSNLDSKSEHLQ